METTGEGGGDGSGERVGAGGILGAAAGESEDSRPKCSMLTCERDSCRFSHGAEESAETGAEEAEGKEGKEGKEDTLLSAHDGAVPRKQLTTADSNAVITYARTYVQNQV